MNQQPDLDKIMTEYDSSDAVRNLKSVMFQPCNVQMKYPVQMHAAESGRMVPTPQFVQSFIGIIQPSQIRDRVLIQMLGTPAILVAKPDDIEALYVLGAMPEQPRIIAP